ncbi:hypothetical protein M409DRAFT_53847 [Zasmidium cellare ATCC 36951]|uniref:BTB domain-containing protein n=1 Tax=Zasmidium cellare ATCC 36951 TaxID=1080233 RepID=A0A6A6CKW9_ZASCE|nr:uncharacterized protein M409DRAFT_53847 [Zasmidium cellare ATCC 36951]KAF2167897.1 hypothetical protein M409DRAFT_53847 [Zasmidium cellare ATCC 36951]
MTFEDLCPAFRAYNALNRLPQNAPPFPFASNGYPIVQPGERYCRHPTGTAGVLCGRVTHRASDLHRHLAQFHQVDPTLRPAARKGRTRTAKEVREDAEFFREIMRAEVYDDTELTYEEVRRRVRERRDRAKARREVKKGRRVAGQRGFGEGGAGEERARVVAEGDVLFTQVALGDDEGTPIDGNPGVEVGNGKFEEERRVQEIVKRRNRRNKKPLPSNFGGGVDEEGEEDEVMIVRVVERHRSGEPVLDATHAFGEETTRLEAEQDEECHGDGERIPDASLVVDVEEVESEEGLLEQHVERVDHETAVRTKGAVSGAGMELKEEVQQKTPERQDEEDWGLAAAAKFLDSFDGYSGLSDFTQKPVERNDSALSQPYEDYNRLDPDVGMPDMSIKKQSPETPAVQAIAMSPTPPNVEDGMVYRSPYFSKSTHISPEPKPKDIAKKTPFDWSPYISKKLIVSEPKHEGEDVQEQDCIDSDDDVDSSAEKDQEILELELAKSEYVLELAPLKRKEAEAELGLLEVEQRLMEARAAYVAYMHLSRLPKNAPEFEYDKNGYPVLHFGERYCRAIHPVSGVICGQGLRPPATTMLKLEYKKAARFYEELMKYETYANKRVGVAKNPSLNGLPFDEGSPDEDDDEPLKTSRRRPAIKQESDHADISVDLSEETQIDGNDNIALTSNKRHSLQPNEMDTRHESRTDDMNSVLGRGDIDRSVARGHIPNGGQNSEDEEELRLELTKAEAEEELQRVILRKIELKRKLVSFPSPQPCDMADERPAKRRRFTSDIVTIIVGTDNVETFTTHTEVLKKHSPFFKAALDKKWQEGQSLQIELAEDEVEVVEAYLGWLYDGKIDPPTSPRKAKADTTFPFMARLYVFGEKIQDTAFCNSVMDAITSILDAPEWEILMPAFESVKILYDGTAEDSPARKFFASYYQQNLGLAADAPASELHPEFARDLLSLYSLQEPTVDYTPVFPQREKWYKTG